MQSGEKENVYLAYNKIAEWFDQNRPTSLMEKTYLDQLISATPTNGTVLDIGCGTGKPILQYLQSNGLQVTGVDASSAVLSIAQANFPDAEFILQDMRLLELNRKFDAVIAWHSFFHLKADDQPAMFQVFKQHINLGGTLLFTSGTEHGEAWGMNGGENLFHASLDTASYQQLLNQHGFTVLRHQINDPDCGGANVWLAQYKG